MHPAKDLSVLVANDDAHEVKLASVRMREFYPGCRIEAVYSAQEVLEWASKKNWHVILLDEQLTRTDEGDVIPLLRTRAPYSTLIVQIERYDASTAARLMQAGADDCLSKKSPVFLAELPIVVRKLLEKQELRTQLDLARERHLRLTESLTDFVFELDANGRFAFCSPSAQPLLGYTAEELTGTHYSVLLDPKASKLSHHALFERRRGARATRNEEIRLTGKNGESLNAEISTSGLHDGYGQFLGTVGCIRPGHAQERSGSQSVAEHAPAISDSEISSRVTPVKDPSGVQVRERRRDPRMTTEIPTRLTFNGTYTEARVLNVSLSGLFLTLDRATPVGEHQPVHLGFVSDIAVLNIQGRVRSVRENIRPGQEQDEGSSVGLAIEFPTLGATDGPILASLLEELRVRPGSVKVTAFLIPREARDLILEMNSGDDGTLQLTALRSRPEGSSERPSIDRRLAPRVNLALAAQLKGWTESLRLSPHTALTANLSMGGVSLRLEAHENLIGRRCYVRLPTLHAMAPGRGNGEKSISSFTVLTEVVWVQPDCSPLSELRTVSAAPTLRAGLRFVYLNDETYRHVAELVGQFLTTPLRLHQRDKSASVNSEFLTCRNDKGQRIALYYDHPRERLESHSPVAIISPGYGDTKRDHVTLAYYLARNGFHVLRYDHTDHVGESEGDIADFTLTSMEHDLSAVLDFAGQRWPTAPTMVVATNVAGRVALKHATRDPRMQLLVLIACVVDLRATLHAVHREDLLGAYRAGIRHGTANVLGFTNHRDCFLDDAIVHGYADLDTTIRDAERVQTPVILLGAEKDSWVTLESLKQVQRALRGNSKHFYLIPQGAHHLSENSGENGSVLRQVLTRCIEEFTSPNSARVLIEVPQQEITIQYQLERERARAHHPMDKAQLVEFWREYLHHSQDMINASDFWQLLDQLYRLPGPLKEEEKILDAGCGGGSFGMCLLTNQAYQRRNSSDWTQGLPSYVGIDFVPEALAQAQLNLLKVTQQLRESPVFPLTISSPIKVSFNLTDLNDPLPFHDNQFDRIVCNLVVAYLHNPLLTLREFMRVLVPKGLLILTNLKPHADIFQIYRAIIRMKSPERQEEPSKALLSNFGKIIQGERNGVFRFFSREELSTLLSSIGAVRARIHTTFADQAYLAVAEKPVS